MNQKISEQHLTWKVKLNLKMVAIGLAIIGQLLLTSDRIFLGICCYVIAAISFILFMDDDPKANATETYSRVERQLKIPRKSTIFIIAAIIAAIATFIFFSLKIHAIVAWICFLLSISLFLIGCNNINPKYQNYSLKTNNWNGREISILAAIVFAGLVLRLIKLNEIPFGTWYDEADFGLNAKRIITEPGFLPVFFESIGRVPAYFMYLAALSFKIFGISTESLRYVSALFGSGTILVAYYCGKEIFNKRIGLILAFFISFSRWNINWSRIGLDNITVPFFELLTIFLLIKAIRKNDYFCFAIAGISLGLGLSFYSAMRIFPFVILIWLVSKFRKNHTLFTSFWKGYLLFGLGVLIVLIPLVNYAIFNPDIFWGRVQQTSIFNGKTTQAAWTAISETTKEHLLMFNLDGDQNGRHNIPGKPMLDPITGALMVLGFFISLVKIKKSTFLLLLAWFLLMLLPGILSLDFESPQSLRAIGALPAAFLLACVPIFYTFKSENEQIALKYHAVIRSFFIILLSLVAVINSSLYFTYQAKSDSSWSLFSTPETIIAKRMNEIGNEVDYFVSTYYYTSPTISFLAPQIKDYQRLETYDIFPIQVNNNRTKIVFVDPGSESFIHGILSNFPASELKRIYSPEGQVILNEIQVEYEDIHQNQGLLAKYYLDEKTDGLPSFVAKETEFQFNWGDRNQSTIPYFIEWSGVLFCHTFGSYRFAAISPEESRLFVDGTEIRLESTGEPGEPILLAKGNHLIRIQTKSGEGMFKLLWQPPIEDIKPLTASSLFVPPVTTNGLLGLYYGNGDWQGEVKYAQIDPSIDFYFHNQPLPRPYSVEWVGRININQMGDYGFYIDSVDEAILFIDEELILDNRQDHSEEDKRIHLTTGMHTIRVRYADRSGYSHIHLFWTPPEKDRVIIPQEVLFQPEVPTLLVR